MGYLSGNDEHPSANDVYTAIREQIPNVSLGTIYRNLNQLAAAGEIRKIRCGDGPDRFDYHTEDHGHFVCTKCGRFFDVPNHLIMINATDGDNSLPGRVDSFELMLEGVCRDCLN